VDSFSRNPYFPPGSLPNPVEFEAIKSADANLAQYHCQLPLPDYLGDVCYVRCQ